MKYKIICNQCQKSAFNSRKMGKFCSKKCSQLSQKRRKFPHSKEWEEKRLKAVREASKKRIYPKGYKRPESAIRPMREALIKWQKENPEKKRELAIRNLSKNKSLNLSNENSPNWKGGKTNPHQYWKNKHRKDFIKHREEVLKRDDYKCKNCGSEINLNVHHIVSVADYPELAFLRMNGITLCKKCHYKTDNYGGFSGRIKKLGKNLCIIITIPHNWQDYSTVGNWGMGSNGECLILVSDIGNDDYEFLVALHELIELHLCKKRGILEPDIAAFDIKYESEREKGLHSQDAEPGDHIDAPYRKEHFFATNIERLMANELGVDWAEYERTIMEL